MTTTALASTTGSDTDIAAAQALARQRLEQAVQRMRAEGGTDKDIAAAVGCAPSAVRKIRARYQKSVPAGAAGGQVAELDPGVTAPAPIRSTTNPDRIRETAEQVVAEVVFHRCFGRNPELLDLARTVAAEVVVKLQQEGTIKRVKGLNRSKTLDEVAARPADERPVRGISHLVALSIVLIRLSVISRDTVRAMIPEMGVPETTVDIQFNRALRMFAQQGWVAEDAATGLIRVRFPDFLARWYEVGVDPTNRHTAAALRLARAVERINASITGLPLDDALRDRRRHELLALRRLMESKPVLRGADPANGCGLPQ